MKRYVHGTAVIDDVLHSFCYDRTNGHGLTVIARDPDRAGRLELESRTRTRALILHKLETTTLSQLPDGWKVEESNQSPYWVRERMERMIITKLVEDVLGNHGSISVNDGEEWVVKRSRSNPEVLGAIMSTEMDILKLRDSNGDSLGTVTLVYGNDGWDVMADGSWSSSDPDGQEKLAAATRGADELAEALEFMYA